MVLTAIHHFQKRYILGLSPSSIVYSFVVLSLSPSLSLSLFVLNGEQIPEIVGSKSGAK
jgi:hypothetical protein